MRAETNVNARAEIGVLDTVSKVLRKKIEDALGAARNARASITSDPDLAIGLHSVEEGLRESFEELARRGYLRSFCP